MFIKMFTVKPDDLSYGGKRIDSYKFSSNLYTCGGIYIYAHIQNEYMFKTLENLAYNHSYNENYESFSV